MEIPINDGTYDVTIHFAYPDRQRREFDVYMEGFRGIRELGLEAEAQGPLVAQTIDAITEVTDGSLTLGFETILSTPIISAIEVHKSNSGSAAVSAHLSYIPGSLTVEENGLVLS